MSNKTRHIFLIVGDDIVEVDARIVGTIAEVPTLYGAVEFSWGTDWFLTRESAEYFIRGCFL